MSHRPQTVAPLRVPESLVGDVAWAWPSNPTLPLFDQIQTDTPAGYWRAVDFTGTGVPDVGVNGYGNDAAVIGVVRTGRDSLTNTGAEALWFDGVTGALIVPDNITIRIGTGSDTWACWFHADRSSGTETLLCKADAGGANGIVVSLSSDGTLTAVLHNTVTCTLAANARDARPHALAVVFDRAAQQLWMVYDGTPTARVDASAIGAANLSSTADFAIGCRYLGNSADQFFMGWIDEVCISSIPLANDRAALQYRAGTNRPTAFVGTGPVNIVNLPALYLLPGVNAPQATGSGGFTLAATIVLSASVVASASVCDMLGAPGQHGGCAFLVRSGALAWGEANNSSSLTTVVLSRALTAGTTLRTAWVHSNSVVACYLDGTAIGSMSPSSWTSQNTVGIGGSPVTLASFSFGAIRDVVTFARPLTAGEVRRLTDGLP